MSLQLFAHLVSLREFILSVRRCIWCLHVNSYLLLQCNIASGICASIYIVSASLHPVSVHVNPYRSCAIASAVYASFHIVSASLSIHTISALLHLLSVRQFIVQCVIASGVRVSIHTVHASFPLIHERQFLLSVP